MGIAKRLGRLQGRVSGTTGSGDLAGRLRRLRTGVRRHAGGDEADLAATLGGRLLAPGVICIERRVPLPPYRELAPRELPGGEGVRPRRLLFLDTETTGLAGGSGTLVFLLGLARHREGEWVCRQYLLSRIAGERALLEQAAAWAGPGADLVTYNGRCFDLPLLETRFRLAGVANPFAERPHLDLLQPVRRAFSPVWPDCRLATAERRLLGLRRRDDLPGAQAPAAWLGWLRGGEQGRLAAVCRHNRQDILSLVALLPALLAVYRDPVGAAADPLAMARLLLRRGREPEALSLLQSARRRLPPAGALERARLLRRRGRWAEAVAIWQELAREGSDAAREHLAKYYEHIERDYPRAQHHTRALPDGPLKRHRHARLERLLARSRQSEG